MQLQLAGVNAARFFKTKLWGFSTNECEYLMLKREKLTDPPGRR